MNANTALRINEAVAQAIECGESEADILAQVNKAMYTALVSKYETQILVAQHRLARLRVES
jgi:hypothetical protein